MRGMVIRATEGIIYTGKCFVEDVLLIGGGTGVVGESTLLRMRDGQDDSGPLLFSARVPQDSSQLFHIADFWEEDFGNGVYVELIGPGTPAVTVWLEPDNE